MKNLRICVVDGYTLNPGDLSWDELSKLGQCIIYERTKQDELIGRLKGAEIVVTNKVVLDASVIKQLPDLKCIIVSATGYNVVDVDAARKRNIPVCNIPAYSSDSVAQMVFAHILNLTQHVAYHNETVKKDRWVNSADFAYWEKPLIELAGMKLGIIGYGRIGKKVAEIGQSFGMNILVNTPGQLKNLLPWFQQVDLKTVFSESDILSLHCPLTDQTYHLVNKDRLGLMKRSAILINTGRGQLIDEQALADALNKNLLAAAGLDVLSVEPPEKSNPLLGAKNCIITPHIAWATQAARQRLMHVVAENVNAFIKGTPQNVVNFS